jgi:hypothetical protein
MMPGGFRKYATMTQRDEVSGRKPNEWGISDCGFLLFLCEIL